MPAIQLDNTKSGSGLSGASISSFAVAGNFIACCLAWSREETVTKDVSGVTWNSGAEAFTKIVDIGLGDSGGVDRALEIWYLKDPTKTTATVQVNTLGTGGANVVATARSYADVDVAATVLAATQAWGATGITSRSVNIAVILPYVDWVVGLLAINVDESASMVDGSGQVNPVNAFRADGTHGNMYIRTTDERSSADPESTSFSWTNARAAGLGVIRLVGSPVAGNRVYMTPFMNARESWERIFGRGRISLDDLWKPTPQILTPARVTA